MSKKKNKHKPVYTDPGCHCHDRPEEVCRSCGEEWPCTTWQQTKEYRIEQLEIQLANLEIQLASTRRAADAAKREAQRAYEKARDFDSRMKAMEVYNQRLFDLGKQVRRLETRADGK